MGSDHVGGVRLNRSELVDTSQPIPPTYRSTTAEVAEAPSAPHVHPDLLTLLKSTFFLDVGDGYVLRDYDRMYGEQRVIQFLERLSQG